MEFLVATRSYQLVAASQPRLRQDPAMELVTFVQNGARLRAEAPRLQHHRQCIIKQLSEAEEQQQ